MPSENNLTSVFTDIANAIRNKKGSANLIKPTNMADEISTIETSGGVTLKTLLDTTKTAAYLFQYYTGTSVDDLISYSDTSNVTTMQGMFYYCSNLTTIPQLDTSNVTNMMSMFAICNKLTTIPQLNTSKVTDMEMMFAACNELTTIQQLDTSKVTNMSSMFQYCYKLTTIPQLDTSKVINMIHMFLDCYNLTTIDITHMNITSAGTEGVNSYAYGFANGCCSLTKLIIRNMTTIPVIDTNSFYKCYHFDGTVNEKYNPNGLKDGRIYVPDDKAEELKAAPNWSVYADIIVPLSTLVE